MILGRAETSARVATNPPPALPGHQPTRVPSLKRHSTSTHAPDINKSFRNESRSLTTKLTMKGAASWISGLVVPGKCPSLQVV